MIPEIGNPQAPEVIVSAERPIPPVNPGITRGRVPMAAGDTERLIRPIREGLVSSTKVPVAQVTERQAGTSVMSQNDPTPTPPVEGLRLPAESDLVRNMDEQRFACDIPQFADVVANGHLLTGQITGKRYDTTGPVNSWVTTTVTEAEAVAELDELMRDPAAEPMGVDMQRHLTYLSHPALQTAAAGLAVYWQSKLEADQKLHIIAPRGGDYDEYKSPAYVLDAVLRHIPDERLAEYARSDRLTISETVFETVDCPDSNIIVVDDTMISGGRMRGLLAAIGADLPLAQREHVEVNLAVTGRKWLGGGMYMLRTMTKVPIRSYYRARPAPSNPREQVYIGMAHGTPTVGMEVETRMLARVTGRALPVLGNVVQPYRAPDWRPARLDWFMKQRQ